MHSDADRAVTRLASLMARCDSNREDALARRTLLRFAAACARVFPELAEQALARLAIDDELAVRKRASAGLRFLLARLGGLSRIRVVMDWALSEERRLRAAVARALRSHVPVLGIVPALDALAHDRHADVRRAACAASARRVRYDSDAFAEIVREGTRDIRRSVRRVAIVALGRMAARTPSADRSIDALYQCVRSAHPGSARSARHALERLGCYDAARVPLGTR